MIQEGMIQVCKIQRRLFLTGASALVLSACGGNVLGLLPPGISAPPGAVSVTPGPGAALIAESRPSAGL